MFLHQKWCLVARICFDRNFQLSWWRMNHGFILSTRVLSVLVLRLLQAGPLWALQGARIVNNKIGNSIARWSISSCTSLSWTTCSLFVFHIASGLRCFVISTLIINLVVSGRQQVLVDVASSGFIGAGFHFLISVYRATTLLCTGLALSIYITFKNLVWRWEIDVLAFVISIIQSLISSILLNSLIIRHVHRFDEIRNFALLISDVLGILDALSSHSSLWWFNSSSFGFRVLAIFICYGLLLLFIVVQVIVDLDFVRWQRQPQVVALSCFRNCCVQFIQIDSMVNVEDVFVAIQSYQLTWNLSKSQNVSPKLLISEQEVGTDVDYHLWVILNVLSIEKAFKNNKVFLIGVIWQLQFRQK